MKVIYMAHPVAGDVEANLARAKQWLLWMYAKDDVAVLANWILDCELLDDSNPADRAAGMDRNLAIIERCDELWLVGGKVSSGMAQERDHALSAGCRVVDLTALGASPPPQGDS